VATRYRHCVGAAMTLAVMGYHFQVMTMLRVDWVVPHLGAALGIASLFLRLG
jgi:hypothetical protein